jgi:cytochrome oxidase Cu insertion factor (SCO1/SenC/PrrC family)
MRTGSMPEIVRRALIVLLTGFVLAMFALEAMAMEVGQKAPDFTLAAPDGKPVKLSDLLAKGPVAMYTFIQAFTAT